MAASDDGTEPVVPVAVTSGPPRGRTRLGALLGVVAIASGVAGFALGRASGPDGDPVATARDAAAASPSDGAAAGDADARAPIATDAAVNEEPASEESATTIAAGADGESAATSSGGGGGGQVTSSAWSEPPLELLAERRFDDGTVMRAHRNEYAGEMGTPWQGFPGIGDWEPAPWCTPSGDLRVSIAAPDSINLAWAPWYREPKDGLAIATVATGYVESSPRFGIVAQVPADVTAVTLTTASGTDTAPAIGGVALLLVAGPIDESWSVSLDRPSGPETHDQVSLTETWSSGEYRDACEPPPPALPPAGEQPADTAAAEAEVRVAWDVVHTYDPANIDQRLALLDDATGVEQAWEAIGDGEYAEAARTSTTTIRELVFTSPTEAWFRYDLGTSITDFPNRYGVAVLGDDGAWRITRASVCQDIALAPGFGCLPSVSQVLPPSAADDPRYGAPWPGMAEG